MNSKWRSNVMGWLQRQSTVHSSLFKRQSLSNARDNRLIFAYYNIPRSLIHEPKQAHYACNRFTFSLAYVTHCLPRSQLLKQLPLLYMHTSLTAYRAPRSQLLNKLALLHTTHCVPCSYPFTIKTQSGRVFCSYSIISSVRNK